jgi:hypothetical protein
MKTFRNTLIFAVVLAIVVIAVKIALSGDPVVPPAPEQEPIAQAPAEPPPPLEPILVQPPLAPPASDGEFTMAQAVNLPEDEGEHGEFTTSTDIHKQKIFKSDPKLAQFDYFREHVLLDSVSREDYRKLLADKEMLEQTRKDLLHPTDAKESMSGNVKRLMKIDYLREALSWKEHPGRGELMGLVENIILEDSFTSQMDPTIKRSLAATKMELYQILSDQDPARALALVEKAEGTRLEKMLQYFAESNQLRMDREREISLQARNTNPTP